MVALKLWDAYDFVLEERIAEVSSTLIYSMKVSPYFMEIKLRIIEDFTHLMDFDTI